MILEFDNINDLQLYILEHLKESGELITTRNQTTLETTSIYLKLNNIRKRCTTLLNRGWSFPFALGELSWHLSGSNKLDFIEHYAKEWKNISEDGQHINGSCYGFRIFSNKNGESQWEKLIRLFKKDLYTRRAVIDLYDSDNSLEYDLKDIACSCSIQFLYRNNQLDATVYMRSNDIIWGLPNDIFFFTFLQELLSKELNIKPGTYNHLVGSLHLYERHFNLADKIIQKRDYIDFQMPSISKTSETKMFINLERDIRLGELSTFEQLERIKLDSYWKDLLSIILLFEKNKRHENIILSNEFILSNQYLFMIDKFISGKNHSTNIM